MVHRVQMGARKSTKAGGLFRQIKATLESYPCPWMSPECGLEPGGSQANTQWNLASELDWEISSALCCGGKHQALA